MNVASIRKAQGLTQSDLAELSGVEQPTISRIERGFDGVSLRTMKQVAEALGVKLSDLFDDDYTAAERKLIESYRQLPPDRRKGWLDIARLAISDTEQEDQ